MFDISPKGYLSNHRIKPLQYGGQFMKILNFGEIIKKLRTLENITQSELVDLVDIATHGESGIDAVSVSRWENNVISPCHRRQLELVSTLGYELKDLIDDNAMLVSQDELRAFLLKKVVVNNYWDFASQSSGFESICKAEITNNGLTNYLFTDKETQIPVASLTYHYENSTLTKGERYLVIDSIYCTNAELLLDLVSYIMSKLINREIVAVVYKSKQKNSPLSKFTKSIGFKILDKKDDEYISFLTYADVLYNQIYFGLACCYQSRIRN